MAILIRFESESAGRTLTATIRREPDGLLWTGSGWGAAGLAIALPAGPASESYATTLHDGGSVAIGDDGVYAVLIAEGGSTVAVRYATVIGGSDGNPEDTSESPGERPAEVADVLLAVRERLVESGEFADAQASIGLADEPEPHPDDGALFCRVCPLDSPADDMQYGGGRHETVLRLPILVRVFQRRALDRPGVARRDLAGPGGALRKARAVIDALSQFMPADAAANQITCEPLALAAPARPARYSGDALWYRADVQFSTLMRLRFGDESIDVY